MSVMTLSVIS